MSFCFNDDSLEDVDEVGEEGPRSFSLIFVAAFEPEPGPRIWDIPRVLAYRSIRPYSASTRAFTVIVADLYSRCTTHTHGRMMIFFRG